MPEPAAAQKILTVLEPYFGVMMSKASLQLSCKEKGIDYNAIAKKDLAALAESIEAKITIFLGTDKAKEVAASLKSINV